MMSMTKLHPCPRVREILMTRIKENRSHLEELMALQSRMEQALEQWKKMPDGVPDGHSVCHLIESVTGKTDVIPAVNISIKH